MPSTQRFDASQGDTHELERARAEGLAEEFLEALTSSSPDIGKMWQQVSEQIFQLMLVRREWDPTKSRRVWDSCLKAFLESSGYSVIDVSASKPPASTDLKESIGGAMVSHPANPARSTQSAIASKPQRTYSGFELESATYRRLKPDLLVENEGKFVVVVGEEMIGPFNSFKEARREGYERFGFGPLYVKQVLAEEPVVHSSRDL